VHVMLWEGATCEDCCLVSRRLVLFFTQRRCMVNQSIGDVHTLCPGLEIAVYSPHCDLHANIGHPVPAAMTNRYDDGLDDFGKCVGPFNPAAVLTSPRPRPSRTPSLVLPYLQHPWPSTNRRLFPNARPLWLLNHIGQIWHTLRSYTSSKPPPRPRTSAEADDDRRNPAHPNA